MSKELHQFRCNSLASAQIGKSGLNRKAKAYARKCAYTYALLENGRDHKRVMHLGLLSMFTFYKTPQGDKFWNGARL